MKTNNRFKTRFFTLLGMLLALTAVISCSESNEGSIEGPPPVVNDGEVATDFKRVVRYEDSKYFDDDLDALVTYALDIRAVRWVYFYRASKGFGGNEPFCATMDELENDEYCKTTGELLYDLIDDIVTRSDQYEEAIERLQDSGVLITPNTTRGILSDAWDFMSSCKKTQTMGRKSVVTIMRELGWTNDASKLQQVYNSLPSELRRDYTNSQDFWRDFSKGTLDSRANQVFVNLYNYADPEFGDKARDLNITPGKNITVAGAELIEKGAALVIDACPISTEVGYGKDLYGVINATSDLVTKGDVKGFMQNAANNLINYGRDVTKLADKMRGLDINYWEYGDKFWDYVGKDISTVLMNDVCFNEHFGEVDNGEGLIPNMVRTKDKNGKEITLLVMVDTNSGQTIITCVFDKDGNIVTNPQLPGQKQVTVVNRQTGKRITKTITVPEKGETQVEVDLDFDENLLEENPKNGELKLSPANYNDKTGEGGSLRSSIITNYLYYTCKTSDDWISATIASDANYLYVKLAKNDTDKERKGQVTVMATDSKGKVLKTAVLPITQAPYVEEEEYIKATPSTLAFEAEGGKLTTTVSYTGGSYTGIDWDDKLSGWISVEYEDVYNGFYTLVVEASANDTGAERSGIITLFSAYTKEDLDKAMKGQVDPSKVLSTTVLVKQTAGAATGEIASVSFDLKLATLYDGRIEDDFGRKGKISAKYDDIRTTRKGNTLHVECVKQLTGKSGDSGTKEQNFHVSFDIDNVDAIASNEAKIVNLSYQENVTDNYISDTGFSSVGNKDITLEIPSIPMTGTCQWGGTRESGISFNNFSYKDTYKSSIGDDDVTTTTLRNDPSDYIVIKITFAE